MSNPAKVKKKKMIFQNIPFFIEIIVDFRSKPDFVVCHKIQNFL